MAGIGAAEEFGLRIKIVLRIERIRSSRFIKHPTRCLSFTVHSMASNVPMDISKFDENKWDGEFNCLFQTADVGNRRQGRLRPKGLCRSELTFGRLLSVTPYYGRPIEHRRLLQFYPVILLLLLPVLRIILSLYSEDTEVRSF
jgi:hypothetical protein